MMEARMLQFNYTSLRWKLITTQLPDIPLFSFEGGQRLQRPQPLYNLSSYRLEYEEIFSEFLDLLNHVLMEETGYMRGW